MSLRALVQKKGFARLCRRFLAVWLAKAAPEGGASLVEVALMLPFLGLLLLGVIDFGRAYYLSIEVQDAAEAGALYGSQNPTDAAGMESAAKADATNVSGMTATATYGCECSDGSGQQSPCPSTPPTCSVNVVNYVTVTTTATYTPLFHTWMWPGLPKSITLNGSAKMRQ
jgi:Flp pilus assembly protein TadG